MQDEALVRSLATEVERTLRPLVAARRVALLDYPDYANVGDSAIWLGQRAVLAALGARVGYAAAREAFEPERLRARVGDGPILLSGGGNLGDLWEHHQRFREQVIQRFPENPIVQLPQTICFRERASLARARAVFDAHPRLVLLVRDRRSLELAQREFRATALLCPDAAFCLGPLARPAPATRATLRLLRSDRESALAAAARPADAVDWTHEAPTALARLQRRLAAGARRGGAVGAWRARAAVATYDRVARERLARGLRLLGSARYVVTDRLHAHVLCLLLGIPHQLLPDRYGKLRGWFETWTAGAALAEFGDTTAFERPAACA
jgi:pyruvyl transferase EpsO